MAVTMDDKTKESGGVAVEDKVGSAQVDLKIDGRGEVIGDRTKEIRKGRLKLDTWG